MEIFVESVVGYGSNISCKKMSYLKIYSKSEGGGGARPPLLRGPCCMSIDGITLEFLGSVFKYFFNFQLKTAVFPQKIKENFFHFPLTQKTHHHTDETF